MKIVLKIDCADIDTAIVDWVVKKGYQIAGPVRMIYHSADGAGGVYLKALEKIEAEVEAIPATESGTPHISEI